MFTDVLRYSDTTGWYSSDAADLYLGGALFELAAGHRLSWIRFSWCSSVPPWKCWYNIPMRPRLSFQFIIYRSPYHPTPSAWPDTDPCIFRQAVGGTYLHSNGTMLIITVSVMTREADISVAKNRVHRMITFVSSLSLFKHGNWNSTVWTDKPLLQVSLNGWKIIMSVDLSIVLFI
jgi:hypothetical protein